MTQNNKLYLGVDIGSISTKAVVIDADNNILAKRYLWTEGNPIRAVKGLLEEIRQQLGSREKDIVSVGTTGSARELIGTILNATIVKNEITAHAIGTLTFHPDAHTIFEIGGQDSKIVIINHGIVVDYAMNTLCAAGTGSFLSSQARRLAIPVEEFGDFALRSTNPTKIAGRCTVFAESDLVHKAQMGYSREDIIAGLCNSIVHNYLNNVGKGKNIKPPVVFQGGVSKNIGVVKAFERITGYEIIIDEIGHLMGAFGVAVLAREQENEKPFDFAVEDVDFRTVGIECGGCPNNCEVICVLRDNKFLDGWGNRCSNGIERAKEKLSDMNDEKKLVSTRIKTSVKIVEKKNLADGTLGLYLEKPEKFTYKAGQYALLHVPPLKDKDVRESTHAMSLASAPHQDTLLMAMRVSQSNFKQTINSMNVGDTLEIDGPLGTLYPDEDTQPVVFLSGGIGIAPFHGIIEEQSRREWPRMVTLFYADKSPKDAVFLEKLQALTNKNFVFVPTMTRIDEEDKSWSGERGRITAELIQKYVKEPCVPKYYIVGLPEMVKSSKEELLKLNVPQDNIKVELFTGY